MGQALPLVPVPCQPREAIPAIEFLQISGDLFAKIRGRVRGELAQCSIGHLSGEGSPMIPHRTTFY
jgi:hypothetical protein